MLATPATHPQFFQGPPQPPAAMAAQGGPGRAAEAAEFDVPKLNVVLYHRTVFTMPLPGKRKQAAITVYFDKATSDEVYVCVWQALAVLFDEDDKAVRNALRSFYNRFPKFREVNYILYKNRTLPLPTLPKGVVSSK